VFILVINCGSSSIKAAVIDADSGERLSAALLERVEDHRAALAAALPGLLADAGIQGAVSAVGHRIVHGGARFSAAVRVDDEVEAAIEALIPLAPLHNPANLAGVRAARALLPDVPHVAVFDTAFHATLPSRARAYALPAELTERHGVRRYGFHGTSHRFVAEAAAAHLGENLRDLRIITCHLGNGASVAAVEYGRSVETSMGMTPLEGLVMGTRCGDVDPGVLLYIARAEGMDIDDLDHLLNRESGLKGLSGVGNDVRDIEERAAAGDERCRLALHVFAHRVRKYVGAYAAVMGGADAVVFTGGIGENSALIRHRVAQRLEFMGARLDEEANREARVGDGVPVAAISPPHGRCRLLVVATDEQLAIAREAAALAREQDAVSRNLTIPVAVSARHIHLTGAAVAALFGEGHELTPHKPLSQPGQFACVERLTIVGPKRRIEGVRVLGPTRPKCQVEISRTDEFYLGLDAPVRASGDVANTPGVTLIGPAGSLTLEDGVICAWRHIHMTPADAEAFGVQDKDVVEVSIDSASRDLVYGDVLVRVSTRYALEMHIDTDEANAAEIRPGAAGSLVGTSATARLQRRRTFPGSR